VAIVGKRGERRGERRGEERGMGASPHTLNL